MKKTNKSGTNQATNSTAKGQSWEHDEIPPLPEPLPYELMEHDIDIEEFLMATNRFIIYTAPNGEPRLRFDKLDEGLYANLVVLLSAPWNRKAMELLKLALEGVRLSLDFDKKSYDRLIRVSEYLRNYTARNKAEAQKELARLQVSERWQKASTGKKEEVSLDELRLIITGKTPKPKEPPKEEPPKDTLF